MSRIVMEPNADSGYPRVEIYHDEERDKIAITIGDKTLADLTPHEASALYYALNQAVNHDYVGDPAGPREGEPDAPLPTQRLHGVPSGPPDGGSHDGP